MSEINELNTEFDRTIDELNQEIENYQTDYKSMETKHDEELRELRNSYESKLFDMLDKAFKLQQ